MALSFAIQNAGFTPTSLEVTATVTLDTKDGGPAITQIQLNLNGKVEGITEAAFIELANGAKVGCPISKALSATPIALDIKFSN